MILFEILKKLPYLTFYYLSSKMFNTIESILDACMSCHILLSNYPTQVLSRDFTLNKKKALGSNLW